jgi:transposase-like protein
VPREESQEGDGGKLSCPFCASYDISRLYIASIDVDTCECASCGARWEEERGSGQYRGRSAKSSVLLPRRPAE